MMNLVVKVITAEVFLSLFACFVNRVPRSHPTETLAFLN